MPTDSSIPISTSYTAETCLLGIIHDDGANYRLRGSLDSAPARGGVAIPKEFRGRAVTPQELRGILDAGAIANQLDVPLDRADLPMLDLPGSGVPQRVGVHLYYDVSEYESYPPLGAAQAREWQESLCQRFCPSSTLSQAEAEREEIEEAARKLADRLEGERDAREVAEVGNTKVVCRLGAIYDDPRSPDYLIADDAQHERRFVPKKAVWEMAFSSRKSVVELSPQDVANIVNASVEARECGAELRDAELAPLRFPGGSDRSNLLRVGVEFAGEQGVLSVHSPLTPEGQRRWEDLREVALPLEEESELPSYLQARPQEQEAASAMSL